MPQILAEILRPASFNDLVLDEHIKKKLEKMHHDRNVMNMIFYGKPGNGKTSAAKMFTEKDKFDAIFINGSLDTTIENIRSKVMSFANTMSLFDCPKICVIDESDYLSKSAQASLRGVIEETSSNCRYLFTANSLDKMHPALLSRLLAINFDMTASQIKNELEKYKIRMIEQLKKMHPSIDESRVIRIIEVNYPDYRVIAQKIEFELI
jgi:DNA polymerase III delta prime subunit